EAVHGVGNVVPDDIFITVGIAGGFTETLPVPLSETEILEIARAGAYGLHTHKSDWDDLQDIVNLAHQYGLTVDA
ncbi:histidine biosynthesis protein, partial [Salmonella enterica subsp. enterica serovar Typhimurium]|nr:histidine biosynthesis protein [Salmonella enterica subsp. enterica serovar Typhimurium]